MSGDLVTEQTQQVIIDLDTIVPAPICNKSLKELVSDLPFPPVNGAKCATQEVDGEIIFWSCGIEMAIAARAQADISKGMMPLLGIKYQVDSWYTDFDSPQLAYDWRTAVVTVHP